MLHWSFFLALLGSVARQSSAVNLRTICNGHPSGTLLPNPQDCNSYYVCQSGPQLAYCDYGLHFDRVNKVCNWPERANCRLEELDYDTWFEKPHQLELGGELPVKEIVQPIETVSNEDKDKLASSVEEQPSGIAENVEKPLHTELSKEPSSKEDPSSDRVDSHGFGQLIASSLSKDPSSDHSTKDKNEIPKPIIEFTDLKPEKDSILVIKVPAVVPPNNPIQVVQVPVVVPAEIPNFQTPNGPKPSSDSTHVIQVPVAVPAEIPNFETPIESQPSKNSPQVVQVPIELLAESVQEIPVAEIVVDQENQTNLIETSISEDEEKVESLIPSKEESQLIELPAPVLPVDVPTPNQEISQPEVAVEKVDSSEPSQNSNQVVELPVPALPIEVPNTPETIPPLGANVEKVESEKLPQNSNQVIELPVPALPVAILNNNVDNTIPSQAQAVVGKVEKPSDSMPSKNPTQIIELPVYSLPEVINHVAKPGFEIGGSWHPTKEHQDLSQSSESIQLPEEDSTSQSAELLEEHAADKTVEQALESESFEEDHPGVVEKVDSKPSEMDQASSFEEDDVQSAQQSVDASVDSSEHTTFLDSSQSSEENVLGINPHHHSSHSDEEKVEAAQEHKDSQSSEEIVYQSNEASIESQEHKASPDVSESSKENVLLPNHHHHPHQSSGETVEVAGGLEPSEEYNSASGSSEEGKPLDLHHHHYQSNVEKVEKPENTERIEESSADSDEDILHHLPTPHAGNKPNVIILESLTTVSNPVASQIAVNSNRKHSNLIVSILSVASFQGNGSANATINRPIVGAHNTETGHPIDVMTGYSSNNVQCIHNGLYFLPHPSSCQKYFICAYHHMHLHSCGRNLIWNYKREQCEMESGSRCYSNEKLLVTNPKPEKPLKPGREDSAEEIVPVTKGPIEPTPMPPLRTTEATEATISRDSTMPKCPAVRQIYLPSLDDCNKYYICIMGQPVLTSCPGNMHWDAKGKFCGNPSEAQCAGR